MQYEKKGWFRYWYIYMYIVSVLFQSLGIVYIMNMHVVLAKFVVSTVNPVSKQPFSIGICTCSYGLQFGKTVVAC